MNLRVHLTLIAALALFATAAFGQAPVTDYAYALGDHYYQIRYAANVDPTSTIDGYVNITNSGVQGGSIQSGTDITVVGSICVHVYTFSPDEQMISCCSCPVTPNGLRSLSVKSDLVNNVLTPAVPSSVVIKLLATAPTNSTTCNAATPGEFRNGLLAWGTSSHAAAPGGATTFMTETPFIPATLSTGTGTPAAGGELQRLTQLCTFIQANGSGYGICNSCRLGGLGAARR